MSEHAISNAKGWLERIRELVANMNAADGGSDDGEAREEIEQSALSVQVRDGWRSPGAESNGAEEFEILLTTGGPALRIIGDLGEYCEPESLRLQWQDWGTPWTDYPTTDEDEQALFAFVGCYYFGEG